LDAATQIIPGQRLQHPHPQLHLSDVPPTVSSLLPHPQPRLSETPPTLSSSRFLPHPHPRLSETPPTLSSSRFLPQQNLLIQFPKHIFITSFNDIICRI